MTTFGIPNREVPEDLWYFEYEDRDCECGEPMAVTVGPDGFHRATGRCSHHPTESHVTEARKARERALDAWADAVSEGLV